MGGAVTWRHQQQRRTKKFANHTLMLNTIISRSFCYSTHASFVFVHCIMAHGLAVRINRSKNFSKKPGARTCAALNELWQRRMLLPTTICEGNMLKICSIFVLGQDVRKGRVGEAKFGLSDLR